MRIIEKKIRDIKSMRVLFIFDYIIILVLIISAFNLGFFSPVTYIFVPLLFICVLFQLLLYFVPKGKVTFDSSGVKIVAAHTNAIICWNNVKCIYYNSFFEFFPLLNHFTIDLLLKVGNEIIDFSKCFGDILVHKKEYLNIISCIPRHILCDNDFMIYKNITEKRKNKYRT